MVNMHTPLLITPYLWLSITMQCVEFDTVPTLMDFVSQHQ